MREGRSRSGERLRANVVAIPIVALFVLGSAGCQPSQVAAPAPIVGAWYTRVPGAPFEYQMYLFDSDGTMQESNPDAGDAHTSDSTGFGAWKSNGTTITAKVRRDHR